MKFSIIVVSLNAKEQLMLTVNSILRQDFSDYEIIVKDGLSTDSSVERIPKDERIQIVVKKDTGIYDAMNQALQLAKGEYVFFLNCGDYLHEKDVLSRVADQMKQNPGKNIYYGDIYDRKTKSKVTSNPKIDAFACYRNVPCHQACFYQRDLIINHPFEIKYRVRADYEQFLWCYFKAHAHTCYMDMIVSSYEGGGYSETKHGLKLSKQEHQEIIAIYMTKRQIATYRWIMLLTLAKLRTWMSHNPVMGKVYNGLKRVLYRR